MVKKKNRKEVGIYVHIPFCLKKCRYCDFLSAPTDEAEKERYVQPVLQEIESISGENDLLWRWYAFVAKSFSYL